MRRHAKASFDAKGSSAPSLPLLAPLALALAALLALASAATASAACPNAVFRSGPSAQLPDCRAYELVTPPQKGGFWALLFGAFA